MKILELVYGLTRQRRVIFTVVPFLMILLAFVNSYKLQSPFLGFVSLIIYLIVNGMILGLVLFSDERSFFRLSFGTLAFVVVLALAGILAIFALQSESWYLLAMIFAAIFCSILNLFFVKNETVSVLGSTKLRVRISASSVSYIPYCVYIGLLLWSFLILYGARTGWVKGPIWNAIPADFLYVYFAATAMIVGLSLLSERTNTRLLLIGAHSIFSLLFIVIVAFPGIIFYDPWYDLGRARSVLYVSTNLLRPMPLSMQIRALNSALRGFTLHGLIVTFADIIQVDMYWTYVSILPVLWGLFVPSIIYRMTEMIGGSRKTAILAAFLTILNLNFLAWGKLGEASSLGIFFFIFFLYLVLRFLSSPVNKLFFLFLILTWMAIGVTHFLPAVVSVLILILAIAIKIHYQTTAKHRFARWISLLVPLAFLVSLLIVPAATVFRGILLPMLGTSSFSVDKLFNTSMWELVFGISASSPVKDAILYQIFPLLGLIGATYVLQKQRMFKRDMSLLLLLGFVAILVNYRILKYTIVGGIFGPGRLRVFRDTLALPFVAVALSTGIRTLIGTESKLRGSFRWKSLLAGFLVAVCLSAWTTAAVYETYEYYTQGLLPTSLEVEAINFISEHADGGYVVFAPHRTAVISWGFIGIPHPEISYLSMGRIGVPANPTVMDMFSYMRDKGVDEGYLILTAFGTVDLQKINAASRDFGLLKVISDGNGHEVYVFNYKIPPLPTGPELMAFYWDTPPSYYLQSDLMRIKINPAAQTIDVTDFFGGLYEGIEFSGTLVGGHSVGNLTSIEYFNASSNEWNIWTPKTEFPSLSLFEFRLRFESQTLLGVFERGDPPLRLWWESGQAAKWSLRTGDYSRLYIPGLIGSPGSFDVNSREYGFLYTHNLTENIILYPASRPELNNTALTYNDIKRNCNFNLTDSRLSYEFHVENTADADQWAYVEVRLPDQVYTGTFPPLYYSIDDGETWTYAPYNVELEGSVPVVTYGGAETNWFFTIPRSSKDPPTKWWSFERALGGSPTIPDRYTDSGGAQNKMIYGFYLPAKDKILVRLGVSVYYARPLETTYVFDDSANIYYGLRNMEQGLVKLYNPGSSESVVGLLLSRFPTGLSITQNEDDKITSIHISLPAETILALLSETDVNTELDSDTDGIPDQIP